MSADLQHVIEHIGRASGKPFNPARTVSMGGGCVNTAMRLSDGEQSWFVKLNDARLLDMFEAEAAGLQALADTQAIRVPRPLCHGIDGNQAYVVMEYISFGRSGSAAEAGRQLAQMHRRTSGRFGWFRDNTIGSTHQPNAEMDDWIEFWRERRLGFQLRLAAEAGYGGHLQNAGDKLLDAFPSMIDHAPAASLLHGDLWGGNLSYDSDSNPVIYDPAVYFGDREADIAMTELFGGFGRDFYAAYNESWPLDPGYATRKTLYNVYHILNHLNMFGHGYHGQAVGMIDKLLAELR